MDSSRELEPATVADRQVPAGAGGPGCGPVWGRPAETHGPDETETCGTCAAFPLTRVARINHASGPVGLQFWNDLSGTTEEVVSPMLDGKAVIESAAFT